jgi:hypothetical protein
MEHIDPNAGTRRGSVGHWIAIIFTNSGVKLAGANHTQHCTFNNLFNTNATVNRSPASPEIYYRGPIQPFIHNNAYNTILYYTIILYYACKNFSPKIEKANRYYIGCCWTCVTRQMAGLWCWRLSKYWRWDEMSGRICNELNTHRRTKVSWMERTGRGSYVSLFYYACHLNPVGHTFGVCADHDARQETRKDGGERNNGISY